MSAAVERPVRAARVVRVSFIVLLIRRMVMNNLWFLWTEERCNTMAVEISKRASSQIKQPMRKASPEKIGFVSCEANADERFSHRFRTSSSHEKNY